MTTKEKLQPVRSHVEVDLEPGDAFELFTVHIARWWPLRTHSVSGERAEGVVFEMRPGGEIVELGENGERHVWGTVTALEPGSRIVFTWHPGRDRRTAQEVAVTFHRTDAGTRVELEHRGWESLGDEAVVTRTRYETGWDTVLGECFGEGARLRRLATRNTAG